MDTNDILADRAAAGARYASALGELRAAYIALSAIDRAMANGNNAAPQVATFRGDWDAFGWELRHPEFAPSAQPGIIAAARTAADGIIKQLDGVPR